MGPSALPIAASTLLAILFGSAIAAIVVILVMRRGFARVNESSCGSCGYAVTGLEGLRCPECGADLREVGIVAPHMRRHVPWPLWVLVWTMLLPFPALLISNLVHRVMPRKTMTIYSAVFSQPNSNTHQSAIIAMRTADLQEPFVSMQIAIRTGSGPPSVLVLDENLRDTATGSTITADGPIDATSLGPWMRSIGLPANTAVDAEAKELAAQVQRYADGTLAMESGKYASIAGNTSMQTTDLVAQYAAIAAGFWFIAWLLGVTILLRRCRPRRSVT